MPSYAHFEKTTPMPCDAASLYDWHGRMGAFARLAPPWKSMRLRSGKGSIDVGAETTIETRVAGVPLTWKARIESNIPGRSFVDEQISGPFASWKHQHVFDGVDEASSVLRDRVEYRLPGGRLGSLLGGRYVRRELERLFTYRHRVTGRDLSVWRRYRDQPRWKILIAGGSGFLGQRLGAFLQGQGESVAILSRHPGPGDVGWDPRSRSIDEAALEGFDIVINLAGTNLADGRWTESFKRKLYRSRIDSSRLLVGALSRLKRPPSLYVGASGIGFYGDCDASVVDETRPRGEGFLAELCEAWEDAGEGSSFAGRILHLRTGVVIDAGGGALAKMTPPFAFGLGGPLGSGKQWMPWIGLEDWIGGVYFAMRENLAGPVNLAAPQSERNVDFSRSLGRALGRPAALPVPKRLLELLLGEFAEEALLSSCRAVPQRLLDSGYRFGFSDLEAYLRFTLGKLAEDPSVGEH